MFERKVVIEVVLAGLHVEGDPAGPVGPLLGDIRPAGQVVPAEVNAEI